LYAIYLPHGGNVTVELPAGKYGGVWWDASTGREIALAPIDVTAPSWTSPAAPGSGDWALLFKKNRS